MKKNRKGKSTNGDEIDLEGRVTDGLVPGSQVKWLGSRWGGKPSNIPHSCHFYFLSFKSYGFYEAKSSHIQLCSDFYVFHKCQLSIHRKTALDIWSCDGLEAFISPKLI